MDEQLHVAVIELLTTIQRLAREGRLYSSAASNAIDSALQSYGAAQAAAQKERDAELADAAAQEYSARQAVDEETHDYLTGAETCARRIALLIRDAHP